jgi:hypothetical protein
LQLSCCTHIIHLAELACLQTVLLLLVLLVLLLLLPVSGGATFFYPAGTPISSSSLLAPFYTSGWGGYW